MRRPECVSLVSACVFTAGPRGPVCADGQLSITPPSAPAEPGELTHRLPHRRHTHRKHTPAEPGELTHTHSRHTPAEPRELRGSRHTHRRHTPAEPGEHAHR